jgi:hypothetical protein
MFTVKRVSANGIEVLFCNVDRVLKIPPIGKSGAFLEGDPGITLLYKNEGKIHFAWAETSNEAATLYVMNDTGKTVATYEL